MIQECDEADFDSGIDEGRFYQLVLGCISATDQDVFVSGTHAIGRVVYPKDVT